MKRAILSILILISFSFKTEAQIEDIKTLFEKFSGFYYSGDMVKAEGILLAILDSKMKIPDVYLSAIYNNLLAINVMMGRYEKALDYCSKAESITFEENNEQAAIAAICINKAMIYRARKSYDQSIQYLDKSIRIYNKLAVNNDRNLLQNLSSAYLNIGIVYYELKKYSIAREYLEKSAKLKVENNLSGLALVNQNLAMIFARTGNVDKAEEYYLLSISDFKKEYGEGYYKLIDAYFDFGLYLRSTGKNKESLEIHRKALSISQNNFGAKHTFVSLADKLIGDYYLNQAGVDSALFYYQRALIAVVKDFNDTDIFSNPSIDSAIFNIRLLDNLKSKAIALRLYSGQQKSSSLKLRSAEKGLETIELTMQLIDRIRNSFLTEESRIYLAENEKETYITGVQIARDLYDISGDRSALTKMYDIAKKAKAAVLRNEISENELSFTAGIPDSLRKKREELSGNIAAYNNLILEETRKIKPDNKKIIFWKDALFEFNRENERGAKIIESRYPMYAALLQKTEPLSTTEIQKRLSRDEVVLDYLLSNQYSAGKRKLYIFILTRNRLDFAENDVDSSFSKNVEITRGMNFPDASSALPGNFRDYLSSLNYFYVNLIEPAKSFLRGKRVVIIPDEEIGMLPFDAFLKEKAAPDRTDYEGLPFLINDYAISFRYASSLIRSETAPAYSAPDVFTFSPDYAATGTGNDPQNRLIGAGKEIDSILDLFPGTKFTGQSATKSNFMATLNQPGIIHLAMHSLSDSSDSRYSYLLFNGEKESQDNGKLYNYEISLSRINSPMVVLSACNSGTGVLYHGEGIMSLARGFILAGASSVIKTAWEVNDETSARIISRFYYYLSEGKNKDEAMRLAKIEYIKSSPPVFSKPYYWAAYEVLGDNSGVIQKPDRKPAVLIISLVAALVLIFLYFRRRRISFARSL
jgi:CHAT domain-containing protein/tetratricopeptide (TPR) repeat protein